MLWTPTSHFNWAVDNFGATYSDAGIGINSPGHANANTKGANTNMLNGIAEDAYGIAIGFSGGNTAGASRRNLVDILIDPAAGVGNGGSSWAVLINNLYCAGASLVGGGYWYYFPLYLNAGTAIGSANQSLTASTSALRVCIRVFGKPTKPELVKCGCKVETFGAVTATTTGTAITPGTAAMGSWTSAIATTSNDLWWWQAGIGHADANMSDGGLILDVGAGGASNELVCAENIPVWWNNAEQYGKGAMGSKPPLRYVPSGLSVYARAAGTASPESTTTVVVYGVGG